MNKDVDGGSFMLRTANMQPDVGYCAPGGVLLGHFWPMGWTGKAFDRGTVPTAVVGII